MIKKYIITDPCYIIDENQYQAIGAALGWQFEDMKLPSTLKLRGDKEGTEVTIYKIEGTPNGDGSMQYGDRFIGVDAGMLCIAECNKGWKSERFGAVFSTFKEAEKAFPKIIKNF